MGLEEFWKSHEDTFKTLENRSDKGERTCNMEFDLVLMESLPKKVPTELTSEDEKALTRRNRKEESGRQKDQNMWREHNAVKKWKLPVCLEFSAWGSEGQNMVTKVGRVQPVQSFLCLCLSGVSQPQHYWHLGLDNFLLWVLSWAL